MSEPLFVYGTLHPERAPAAIAGAARRLRPLGPATIAGRRLELGEYPGVIASDDPAEVVAGELFALPSEELLAELDDYEGFDMAHPETSLFVRVLTVAIRPDGERVRCWVYLYRG
jgi:gamma-glutamylcyclotransferase (GGCT)/AIG2-like uncharacterized protein YtfP